MWAVITLLLLMTIQHGARAAEWAYTGPSGHHSWATNFPACGQRQQSPINIFEGDARFVKELGPFKYTNYDTSVGLGMTLRNNGHSALVALSGGIPVTIQGGGLPPGEFRAFQFHFHWGDDVGLGSEHLLSTTSYPMELHIVHYNTKYGNPSIATSKADGLAVLGFFFEVSEVDNVNYSGIVDGLSLIQDTDASIQIPAASVASFLPKTFSNFYRYSGSLTTPPCRESVTWTMFKETIPISESQLEAFRGLLDPHAEPMVNNFRPVQPLNERQVTSNFDPDIQWTHYGGLVNSENWNLYYSACGGVNQSPVDIQTAISEVDISIPDFTFNNYDVIPDTPLTLINTGRTAKVDISATDVTISDGGLPETYQAASIEFRWGSTDLKGSEHTLDSQVYPMEIHIVHYRKSLGSLHDALKEPDGLAILGFFVEISPTDNPGFQPIINSLRAVRYPESSIALKPFSLTSILPPNRSHFFRYSGSLTMPGCYQSVIWTVFKDTIKISAAQLAAFRLLKSSAKNEVGVHLPLVNNFRPVQSLNQRLIKRNFDEPFASWSYYDIRGWQKTYHECKDTSTSLQSPINIASKTTTYKSLPSLVLLNYKSVKGGTMGVTNTGRTVKITLPASDLAVRGGGLPGTYRIDHLHFHWGQNSRTGSEHRIDNEVFPMEMHIVHYNTVYPNVQTASKETDGLAVLAFLFEITYQPNPAYNSIVDNLWKVAKPGTVTTIPAVPVRSLLPPKFGEFYRYYGSLTTPSCNESVIWTVFSTPVRISESQIRNFRNIQFSDVDSEANDNLPLVDNVRPLQKRNGRKIYTNIKALKQVAVAAEPKKSFTISDLFGI